MPAHRGGKRKRNSTTATDTPQPIEAQPAKRLKNEKELPDVASVSSKKEGLEERDSDTIEVKPAHSLTLEKREESKSSVKTKGRKGKAEPKAHQESLENSNLKEEESAMDIKVDSKANGQIGGADSPTRDDSVCLHQGHPPEQCWRLHPENKDAILLDKKEHKDRKLAKKKEKSRQAMQRLIEKQKATKEATQDAAKADGKKRPGGERGTKKIRRLEREARKAAMGVPLEDAQKVVSKVEKGIPNHAGADTYPAKSNKDVSSSKGGKPTARDEPKQTWFSSRPTGGHFLSHDPVFSLDEE
jgi:hypothetical protein